MPLVAAQPPAPTAEYTAISPQPGESAMDALARVGDGIVTEFGGSDTRDSRKNKKLPKQLAALVALRAQGFDNKEIADRLRVSPVKLRTLIKKARQEYGWSDLAEQLAHVAVPQAMSNVIRHLEHEGSDPAVKLGMSTMTREIARGVGILKNHTAVKQETRSESTNVLRVEIVMPEMPPGVQGPLIAEGSVTATPRRALPLAHPAPVASVVDGEVVK